LRVLRVRNQDIADKLDEVLTKILEATSPTPNPLPLPAIRREREGSAAQYPQGEGGEGKVDSFLLAKGIMPRPLRGHTSGQKKPNYQCHCEGRCSSGPKQSPTCGEYPI